MKSVLEQFYRLPQASITPISNGVMNHNYVVQTADQSYVLKSYSTHIYAPDHVRWVCNVQELVRQHGVPVPELVANAQGERVTETATGECYVLSRFVPGKQLQRLQLPADAAYSMGQTLGHLHHALQNVEGETRYLLPDSETALQRAEELIRLAEPHRQISTVDEKAYQVACTQYATLERLAGLRRSLPELPSQWIHGDYQDTNVLFNEENKMTAVLDFDNLRCRPRGLDMMRAMHICFYNRQELLPEAYDFFAGYAATAHELTESEVAAFAPYWTYQAQLSQWPMRNRYEQPEEYDPRWDQFIEINSDFWEKHVERVSEQFVEILHASKR